MEKRNLKETVLNEVKENLIDNDTMELDESMDTIFNDKKHLECPTCKKSFSTCGNLKQHRLNIHDDLRIHSCSYCKKNIFYC